MFSLDLKKDMPITCVSEMRLMNFLLFWKILCWINNNITKTMEAPAK